MPAPYGNLGQALLTFEQELTLVRRGSSEVVDGYVEEKKGKPITFKGVITPTYSLNVELQGVHWKGDSILYVRLTQGIMPDIKIQDIVRDAKGQEWKVLGEEDYSQHGMVKLYDIQKVVGKC
jgi:hypothetical protein